MNKLGLTYIIDDDEITIFLADRMINKVGFSKKIEKFTNAQDALNRLNFSLKVRKNIPDLILFDLNMPGMSGWDFVQEFTKLNLPKDIPTFIVTSSLLDSDIKRSQRYNTIKGIIIKPLNIQKINKILRIMDIDCVQTEEINFMPTLRSIGYLKTGNDMI